MKVKVREPHYQYLPGDILEVRRWKRNGDFFEIIKHGYLKGIIPTDRCEIIDEQSDESFMGEQYTQWNKYEQAGVNLGKLVAEKNRAYGDSFAKCGEFLKLLYPDGIEPDQYKDALSLVRIFDKQMRIANQKEAFSENPYRDIAGYGLLGMQDAEGSQE